MENENPAPTTRQLFACWFTLCRAVACISNRPDPNGHTLDPKQEASLGTKYADELMKQEPR